MAKIKITETVLRDGHQSLIATRMRTDEMLPILEIMDKVGYHSLEMWGGATFDACLRFLNEDPWERLRKIKAKLSNTKLQMLLRGQNILGYKNYPDDVLVEFIKRSLGNGIDIIRIFDALNDLRNIEKAIETTKKYGGHAQGTVVYTISPVHNIDLYVSLAKKIQDMGADSLCIKDMSGILTPYVAYDLVKELKQHIDIPIQLHSHYTSGMASMAYMKAIEAGVDIIDTAISPFGLGTSQPATEPIVAALKNTEFDTGLDLGKLSEVAEYFKTIKEKYIADGILNPNVFNVDTRVLSYQIPGGMMSNLLSQLASQNASDKFEEVLVELPRVREDLGYPPLVTPTSQMVGTQAVFNVVLGERYKMIPSEIKAYVKGQYGKPVVPISKEIKNKIIGDEEVITVRPADLLPPQLDNYKEEIKEFYEQEEDVLTYALFPQVALKFFSLRKAEKYKIDETLVNKQDMTHPV
ncbi:oxaloacetate decarboxylase subunit alpha [Lutispora saccharofermentans]|uniref:Oxaloacetate decarboxylase subunit alpha n=1 Tax=Lutispora saccharofermentans TaxID=3024236 RepID=A0ABT1NF41_9FIRM|nr:oxaloacetate decarboxylase subunit alpha [Lutispora saccharofermentans]MCQ1529859.1 oxaloacetate decarboxylase subunit alpha [Lutispora saccharofermentans]